MNRLKIVLAEKRKTSKWLAEEMGKSVTTVSRWCTNDMQPSLETLYAIAHTLEVDICDLLISTQKQQ